MCSRKMEHSKLKETECWERIRGASLVTQMVKNLRAMQETQVQPLGREDSLERGMATHSSILAWRSYSPWGHKELYMTE